MLRNTILPLMAWRNPSPERVSGSARAVVAGSASAMATTRVPSFIRFPFSFFELTLETGISSVKLGQIAADASKSRDKVKGIGGRLAPLVAGARAFGGPPPLAQGEHINHLDRGGEGHGEVDIAARDVEMHSVG